MTWNREKMREFLNSARNLITGLFLLLFTIITTGIAQPGNALAEEGYGPGTDRFKIDLGAYFPAVSSELQVDVGDTTINLEDVFGLSVNETVWRLDGYWRFAERHRLAFGYYRLNRDARKALTGNFYIGGELWEAGFLVDSELTMDFYKLNYLYSFYQGEKWEIAGSIGTYWVRAATTIGLAAGVDKPPLGNLPPGGSEDLLVGARFESDTFEGPLPLIGLAFDYYITPKWMMTLKGGYFQLTINDYKGQILNLGASLEYQFTRMFGLGLGYYSFNVKVKAEGANGFAEVDYKYHGVQVYGTLRF